MALSPCPMIGYEVIIAAQQAGDDLGAKINAGIQYAKNDMGGGKVILPPGIHTIKTEILYEDNVWLQGCGREATILKLDAGYTSDNLIKGTSKNDLKISDLTLDANNLEKHLLRFNGCQRITGENLGFKNASGAGKGAYLENACKYAHFRELKFGTMPIGIYISSASFASFQEVHADNTCGRLIFLLGSAVADCIFQGLFCDGLTIDVQIRNGPKRIQINGLHSKLADEHSIYLENMGSAGEEIDILNSEIEDASASAPGVYSCIHVEADYTRVRIVNTRTINANSKQKYGVLIDAGASECEIRGGKHEGVTAAWLNNGTGTLIDSRR